MNLFEVLVPADRLHPLFLQLQEPENAPERAVLNEWAAGFRDRDGKFVKEFQTTFESSFWEMYLHAVLRSLGATIDFSVASPDFVVSAPTPFVMEATIAAPTLGGLPAFGPGAPQLPEDLNEFNREAIIRICNSLSAKLDRYQNHYAKLPHASGRPYVVALAPFDRPVAHMASHRPLTAALYGIYFDEEATLRENADAVIRRRIDSVTKSNGVQIPVGLFDSDIYRHVSAVVYSPLATWGKLRALAHAPDRPSIFETLHPNPEGLIPRRRVSQKREYHEDLLDGLFVAHNPYAQHPLPTAAFDHPRVAHFLPGPDRTIHLQAPDDFLLMRQVWTIKPASAAPEN